MFVHYLIPCGVEYSLIASDIFYKMFLSVGHFNGMKHSPTAFVTIVANWKEPNFGYLK